MEYNTQETQGTFESIGTTDVLTHALSRPKHPRRIRRQSKFVKQSQYFNLNRSSNRDNEVPSMRHEIEELKALVRGYVRTKMWTRRLIPTMCQLWTNTTTLRLVALSRKNNMECLTRQLYRSTVRNVSSISSMKFMVDSCLLRLEEHGWGAFPSIQCMGFHWGKRTCEYQSSCQN